MVMSDKQTLLVVIGVVALMALIGGCYVMFHNASPADKTADAKKWEESPSQSEMDLAAAKHLYPLVPEKLLQAALKDGEIKDDVRRGLKKDLSAEQEEAREAEMKEMMREYLEAHPEKEKKEECKEE